MWLLRFSFLCVCRSRDVCEEIKANFPEGKVRRDAIYMNALRCCFTIRTWSRILASQIFFNLRFVSLGIPKVFLILFLYQFMSLKQQIIIATTAAEVVRACEYTFCMLSTMEASVAVVRRTFFILRSSFCLLFLSFFLFLQFLLRFCLSLWLVWYGEWRCYCGCECWQSHCRLCYTLARKNGARITENSRKVSLWLKLST